MKNKEDYVKKCIEIMKKCNLTLEDLVFIRNTSNSKNAEELYYELEEMLNNNQIQVSSENLSKFIGLFFEWANIDNAIKLVEGE